MLRWRRFGRRQHFARGLRAHRGLGIVARGCRLSWFVALAGYRDGDGLPGRGAPGCCEASSRLLPQFRQTRLVLFERTFDIARRFSRKWHFRDTAQRSGAGGIALRRSGLAAMFRSGFVCARRRRRGRPNAACAPRIQPRAASCRVATGKPFRAQWGGAFAKQDRNSG